MLTRRSLRIKVMQSLFAGYLARGTSPEEGETPRPVDTEQILKQLIGDTEAIYDHFLDVLTLCAAMVKAAGADEKGKHQNFVQNKWIKAIASYPGIKRQVWDKDFSRVRVWFRDVIKSNKDYQAYSEVEAPSEEEQRKFAMMFFRRMLLGKTVINEYFSEHVLRWAEDHHIVRGLIEKLIKSYNPSEGKPIELPLLSVDWEDDLWFVKNLFTGTLQLEDEYRQLIAKNTRNWEVERLPLTDRVLLEMAVNELVHFSNIPIKVTINEYIDLARQYSTPKSWQFMNGILDAISKQLSEKGSMKKSGRGLIDNK